jgi:hypothetical protein
MSKRDRREYQAWYRAEKKRCDALGIPMPVRETLPKSTDPEVQAQRRRARQAKYKMAHPEKTKEANAKGAAERNKRWYEKHRAAILEKEKAKRETEGRKATLARYAEKVKERRAIARSMKHVRTQEEKDESKRRNKAKALERTRLRMATDPAFRMTRALRLAVWRVVRYVPHKSNIHRTFALLGTDRDGFMRYIEAQFLPGMTWANYGKWHIDHKRPLASFRKGDEEHIKKACHYTNLQPLWAADNIRKSAKWIPETA